MPPTFLPSPLTVPGRFLSPLTGVAFDWSDPTTFDNVFDLAEASSDVIQSVFLTTPLSVDNDMLQPMKPFIGLAKKKGVKRFVVLGASLVPIGNYAHGAVTKYLSELGVEYAAIRPSWFYQNFFPFPDQAFYADPKNNAVISSTGSSKVGFVDARDIAEAAFHAMTDEVPLNGSYLLFGPELLSYADVAKIISSVTGRSITHRNLTRDEFKEHASKVLSVAYAEQLASLEAKLKAGAEERLFINEGLAKDEKVWKGKRTLRTYFEEIKDEWNKF